MCTPAGPAERYRHRLADLRAEDTRLERRLAWTGNVRFALLPVIAVLAVVLSEIRVVSPFWLAVPGGAFIVLSILFARANQRLTAVRRAAAYAEAGLARLEGR